MGQGQVQAPPTHGQTSARTGAGSASARPRKLEDVCQVDQNKLLGRGSFGVVYRAKMHQGGRPAAVKAMDKAKMKQNGLTDALVMSEVDFMRQCSGRPWFVNLFDFIDTKGVYFIVMELCDGDLEHAAKDSEGTLGEARVVGLVRQVVEGIAFMHSKGICHRDIKPQNAMIVGKATSPDCRVKLADFGIAARIRPGTLLQDKVGTPAFMAPEMHMLPGGSTGYDLKVDMWACGALVVFLFAFEYPFLDGCGRLLKDQLMEGNLPLWDTDVFSGLFQRVQEAAGLRRKRPSRTARDFIRQLLNPKRVFRFSAMQALAHAWFKPGADLNDKGDDMPLLDLTEVKEGVAGIRREIRHAAAGVATAAAGVAQAVGSVQIDPGFGSPGPEGKARCLLCQSPPGGLGYTCAQCNHSLCAPCLQKLPKAECPHCRAPASDLALAQAVGKVGRIARGITEDAGELAAGAAEGLDHAKHAVAVVNVGMDATPQSAEHHRRRARCHICHVASPGMSHVCPICSASVCLCCAREKLMKCPHCPACGEQPRNAEALQELLAAGKAWESITAVNDALFGALGMRTPSPPPQGRKPDRRQPAPEDEATLSTKTAPTRPNPFATPKHGKRRGVSPDRQSPRVGLSTRDMSRESTARHAPGAGCHFCGEACGQLDLACKECGVGICGGCLLLHVSEHNPGCPACCCEAVASTRSLRLALQSAKMMESAGGLWQGLFGMSQELLAIPPPESPVKGKARQDKVGEWEDMEELLVAEEDCSALCEKRRSRLPVARPPERLNVKLRGFCSGPAEDLFSM